MISGAFFAKRGVGLRSRGGRGGVIAIMSWELR